MNMTPEERAESIKALSDYDMLRLLFANFGVVLEDFGSEIYANMDREETERFDACMAECRRRLYEEPLARWIAEREAQQQ